uniref:Uncharacterized protein n=1 Tax=Cacopsylla melanoneura TaxID=428564 RepID=A0A8D8SEC1_9HEMI
MSQRKTKSQPEKSQRRSSQRNENTQELMSQSQSSRPKATHSQRVSNSELQDIANKMAFYLLAVHGCKGVIKRSDLISAVFSKEHGRHFKTIQDLANKKLKMPRCLVSWRL